MKSSAAFLLIAMTLAPVAPSFARTDAESPFKLSIARDKTEWIPGTQLLRLGLVLEVPEKHKVYHGSVKLSPAAGDPVRVVEFKVPPGLKVDDPDVPAGETVLTGRNPLAATLLVEFGGVGKYGLRALVSFQGCSDTICYPPESRTVLLEVERLEKELRILDVRVVGEGAKPAPPAGRDDLDSLVNQIRGREDFSRTVERSGYLLALLAAFGWGFLVSLTPCVWPLIPIVLAVVGARAEGSGWKRGLSLSTAYVFGMSLTYAALGALAGLIGKGVQTVAQSPWLIAVVCLVFAALALSMFGLYDIRLPAGVAAKLSKRRGAGLAGLVATGALSGLVASPCVSAPLLGLFAGVASLGSVWVGMLAGFIFALGMGVILVAAGTSSKALQSLPGAGEWMVSVKQFFGWVMLGAAVWFSHMVVGTTAYRLLMGGLLAAAVLFLAVVRPVRPESTWRGRLVRAVAIVLLLLGLVRVATGPARGEIRWVSSVEEGLTRAQAEGRPAIIDFTADWCVYCHQMDREVLTRPAVVEESRRFVMIRRDVTVHSDAVDELYATYGVAAPPAFVFVRRDGQHATVNRKVDLDTFLRLMRAVE